MVIDQCLDLSCALGQLRNCNCATDLLWAVGVMRHLQDAIQATTAASELSALGGGASVASADPDAPENPADEIARTKALAKALGHMQGADAAGNIVRVPNLTRKLSYWRKALRGLEVPPDDIEWCRALVLLHLHDTSFAALQAVENKDGTQLMVDGWEHRALLLELPRMFGHQLALGPDAQTLLTGIRNAKGIRKPSTGRKKHFETKPTQNASFGKLDAQMLHLGNSHLFHSLICGPFCTGSSTS